MGETVIEEMKDEPPPEADPPGSVVEEEIRVKAKLFPLDSFNNRRFFFVVGGHI